MDTTRTGFGCADCGARSPAWVGRCPGCGAWSTMTEQPRAGRARTGGDAAASAPTPVTEVVSGRFGARPTGVGELDRVLGGGLVPGSVTLVGGEPGIGKSTLVLQVAAAQAAQGRRVLYVSGEESNQQVRLRAERTGALEPDLLLLAETALPVILDHLDRVRPELLVVDSIQTTFDPEVGSSPGSVTQVRECAQRLVAEAKARDLPVVLVGHVTKDGHLAGPRLLEHVVDTVLAFEGDRHHALRLLRAVKHRFGSVGDLGLFEMEETGLVGVPDPSRLFLADRCRGVAGSVVVPTMEGHRPLLVELQALVMATKMVTPRRSAQGVDSGRLALLLAVLEKRASLPVSSVEVYALAVGGVRVVEPGADLALGLAVASSLVNVPVPADVVACGEVGLGGELRQVSQTPRRLAEAARLGFRRAVVPASVSVAVPGLRLVPAATVAEAVAACGLIGKGPPAPSPGESPPPPPASPSPDLALVGR